MNLYEVFVPKQAVGADLDYFDLFNVADSGWIVHVKSIKPVVSGAVAVTGVVGIDLFAARTTAVGTTGTAMTAEGTSLTAMTISNLTGNQQFDLTKVSGRLTPGGGATIGAVLAWDCVFGEETNAGTYSRSELLNAPVVVNEGTGIKIIQGAVAATGNVGFNVLISISPKP